MEHSFESCLSKIKSQISSVSINFDHGEALSERISTMDGPVICSGVGKSGFVMQKLNASLNSIGIRSVFLDPLNALHGDLGVVKQDSLIIMMSNSGSSRELIAVLSALKERDVYTALISGSETGNLVENADLVLKYGFSGEAGRGGLAPTTSSTIQMLIVDSIISHLTFRVALSEETFAANHPSGSLGKKLKKVQELMRPVKSIPVVGRDVTILRAIREMNEFRIGACCVVDRDNRLSGLVTDGDIRRAFDAPDASEKTVREIMTQNPSTVYRETRYGIVLSDLEKRKLNCIPVVDEDGGLQGLLVQNEVAL